MKTGMNMKNMLKQAEKMKEKLEKLQEEAGEKTVEATSGGGMVTVVAKAKGEIISIKVEPDIVNSEDIEMLEDLVTAAVNEALNRGRALLQEALSSATSGLGLPPGLF